MRSLPRPLFALLLAFCFSSTFAAVEKEKLEKPLTPEEAQKQALAKIEAFGWNRTGVGRLGTVAQIDLPPGYRFTGKSGTRKMMEFSHNIPRESQLGILAPEHLGWWVLFSYDDVGYVRDTDKDQLDAAKLLKQLQDGQEAANEEREKRGIGKLHVTGWAVPPRYNDITHNLEWAVKAQDDEGRTSVNYLTKLLGRSGVMHVTLVVDAEDMQQTLPDYQKLLTGFSYQQGQTYAEYRKGDKVAQYALAGLVTAGAGVALVKSGLLAKLGLLLVKFSKVIILGVIAGFAALKKFVFRLFGKKTDPRV